MRRLSMKSKRKKSETNAATDSESEENGVARNNEDNNSNIESKNDNEADSTSEENALTSTTTAATPATAKSTARKRNSRGKLNKSINNEADKSVDDSNESLGQADEVENDNPKASTGKRRKKDDQKASTSTGQVVKPDHEYEVEKLVGHRTIKGRRQFLVRWKGYDEKSDTWENEKDLNCPELMEDFLAEEEENNVESEKSPKTGKTKNSKNDKKSRKSRSNAKKGNDVDQNDTDGQKEFEVEKIIDVYFKKNKSREFLIRWKGFTAADDTWEPEENLNCPDLITKFMQKVEKAKTAEVRELRSNPPHTKRYTLTTHEHGRRLSRRNMDKQRATYHECDE